MSLRREPNLQDPDGFYQALMDAHRGLDDAASRKLDAKLVLLLANHVGDAAVLAEALRLARGPRHGRFIVDDDDLEWLQLAPAAKGGQDAPPTEKDPA